MSGRKRFNLRNSFLFRSRDSQEEKPSAPKPASSSNASTDVQANPAPDKPVAISNEAPQHGGLKDNQIDA